jgi:sugar-specific transcriptional regulator TrmB
LSGAGNDLMDNHEKSLVASGLSQHEARIYISLLEIGPATVSELSQHSGVNRSTVYVVLKSLENRLLAKVGDDRKIRMFMAASPDVLIATAQRVADEQQKIISQLEEAMPALKAVYKDIISKPNVRIYEGKKGLWETYFDIFNSNISEIRVYEDLSNILKVFPDFLEYDTTERLKRGIDIYSIAPAKKEVIDVCLIGVGTNKEELMFIPEEKFKFPVDITIYGDKVAFASPKDLFGIIIEHKEIAAAFKSGFDLAFAEAKRLNDKQGIKIKTPTYHFKTPKDKSKLPEMLKLLEESFKNTKEFLKKYGS